MAGETCSGKSLIKSLSASADELPVPTDPLATQDVRKVTLTGPQGPMIVFERMFLPEGGALPPFRIQIDAETAVVDRMLPTFNIPLTFSLALLAFVLITAAALQVSFGLQPMSRLRRALGAIGSGSAAKLPADFPSEVQPLVDDLNNLIEINGQMVLRARTQAGNLAHALKTPLAVLTDEANRLESRGQDGIRGSHIGAISTHAASDRLSDRTRSRGSLAFGARRAGARVADGEQHHHRDETPA